MEERRLTPDEIDELFAFCSKRNVKEYEIQVELVDHLASSIEIQFDNLIVSALFGNSHTEKHPNRTLFPLALVLPTTCSLY
jgi:hypothetical protein